MQGKISLTPKDIYEKEFKIDVKGFSVKEVDSFLDQIMDDYKEFNEIIRNYELEKEQYLKEIMNLKQELRNVKMNIDIAKDGKKEITNLDILRRISNLEKIVYGKELEKDEDE